MTETSKEYGEALFMLACECDRRREYAEALDEVMQVLRAEPMYLELLASPSIPQSERLAAVAEAFASLPEHVVSFLQLLCEKGRIRSIGDCVAAYRELLDASEHISKAHVVSAVPLTEEERRRLQKKLEAMCGTTVLLDCTVDEGLLGGLTVEIDGKVIDGSLRHRLHEVKEVMNQ